MVLKYLSPTKNDLRLLSMGSYSRAYICLVGLYYGNIVSVVIDMLSNMAYSNYIIIIARYSVRWIVLWINVAIIKLPKHGFKHGLS